MGWQMFFKTGVLKNFTNFKERHLTCCNFIKLYSEWVLNTPLCYLLAKVHRMSTNGLQSLFSITLSDNSKIVNVLYYL